MQISDNHVLVSKQDLIPWLQHQIAEQKKIDSVQSGVTPLSSDMTASPTTTVAKENVANADLQLILPGEGTNIKKQRKTTKQLFLERGAWYSGSEVAVPFPTFH